MESGKTAGQATAALHVDRTASEARRPEAGTGPEASTMRKAGECQSRQGWASSEPGAARSAERRRQYAAAFTL